MSPLGSNILEQEVGRVCCDSNESIFKSGKTQVTVTIWGRISVPVVSLSTNAAGKYL